MIVKIFSYIMIIDIFAIIIMAFGTIIWMIIPERNDNNER